MAPKSRAVTAKALQTLLVHIGAPSSGTKAVLQERFQRDMGKPRLPKTQSTREIPESASKKLRIMSIDMGIKNLAFCEAEVSYPSKDSLDAKMRVLRWEKINLTEATYDDSYEPSETNTTEQGTAGAGEESDPYSVGALSKTAYGLIKKTILAGSPDIILIEKQRWRSGGGSAVQQWTLRVNTLEGMLWAVLQTIRAERLSKEGEASNTEKLYDVFSADPKRVGQYWLSRAAGRLAEADKKVGGILTEDLGAESEEKEDESATKKKPSRTKAEKQAKIALLRSWLTATPASTASVTRDTIPSITFSIAPGAEATRKALCSISKSERRKESNGAPADILSTKTQLKKLDDITDCFLQAAAWVSWESNRLQLQEVWKRKKGSDESIVKLKDEVLVEMIQEIEGP
jgi:cruciform cutting endonuclease 1